MGAQEDLLGDVQRVLVADQADRSPVDAVLVHFDQSSERVVIALLRPAYQIPFLAHNFFDTPLVRMPALVPRW